MASVRVTMYIVARWRERGRGRETGEKERKRKKLLIDDLRSVSTSPHWF